MDGIEHIDDAEVRCVKEKQRRRMCKREEDREVRRPTVEYEKVDMVVGPMPPGTVTQRHKHAQQQVDGYSTHRSKAKIGTKIEKGHGGFIPGAVRIPPTHEKTRA